MEMPAHRVNERVVWHRHYEVDQWSYAQERLANLGYTSAVSNGVRERRDGPAKESANKRRG
jgi:hypothetical protein